MNIIKNFLERYEKQLILPDIEILGQIKLLKSNVLCIGAGGLATTILPYIVASGIGALTIVEHDKIELSNLHRQTIYTTYQIGLNKAACMKTYLEKINPNVVVKIHQIKLTEKTAYNIIKNFDVIVDATDNIETKTLINKWAIKKNIPMIYGTASEYVGQISTFYAEIGPCYNCLYPIEYPTKNTKNLCDTTGVLGPVPGIIGCMQAVECISILLHYKNRTSFNFKKNTLVGSLLTIDMRTYNIHKHTIEKKINCKTCCKQKKTNIKKDILQEITKKNNSAITINTYKKIKHFSTLVILNNYKDTYNTTNYIKIKYKTLPDILNNYKIKALPKNKVIVIACYSSIKSKQAAIFLKNNLKFTNIFYVRQSI